MSHDVEKIEDKIRETMQRFAMLEEEGTLIVGFSGGADSMALLHFLSRQVKQPLIAAHVNHQLRGEEAERDQQAVIAFCEAHHIPLRIHQEDVAARAKQEHQSIEECGRNVRYAFFSSLLAGGSDRIVTAHTLSDSLETVLFHLAKGAGIRGLQGIPPVREQLIRPLIEITRQEVEAYCAAYQLPYVDDSTNFSRLYTRNRIRLDVVPVLQEINPALEQAVLRSIQQLREDDAVLSAQASAALEKATSSQGYQTDELKHLPSSLLSRAVVQIIQREAKEKNHPAPRFSEYQIHEVCQAIRKGTGGISLGNGWKFRAEGKFAFFYLGEVTKKEWSYPCKIPQDFSFFQKAVTIQLQNDANFKKINKFHNLLFNNAMDYDTIASNATWRNRRDGDFFVPQGRGLTKSLKKLFNEAGIPPSQRDKVLLLEASGKILWIEGFGPAEGHGVTDRTERVAWISIEEKRIC